MNCRDWEERLALYLGGDLPPREAKEVERHLRDCPGCQLFSSGLKEAQELLQELHREPIAPAHLAAVRARVLSELVGQTIVSRGLSAFRRWILGFAAVAAMLLVALLVFRPVRSPLPGTSADLPPLGPQSAPAVLPPRQVSNQAPTATRQPVRKIPNRSNPKPGEQVLIRVISDNPDVVIYWIADTRGD
jgi:anti-sigma factor RsiW